MTVDNLGNAPRTALYDRLNQLLAEIDFDGKLEKAAEPHRSSHRNNGRTNWSRLKRRTDAIVATRWASEADACNEKAASELNARSRIFVTRAARVEHGFTETMTFRDAS